MEIDSIVDVETEPSIIMAGEPSTIIFSIRDSYDKPVEGLTISHDRILHVVIISADFTVFAHIHPEDFGKITPEIIKKAVFPVKFTFPKAGDYMVAVDYAVKGSIMSDHFLFEIAGEPVMGDFKKDISRQKNFGDYQVTFSTVPEKPVAGKSVTLKYVISKDKKQVKDLEPYLSAPMHLAIVMADLDTFTHAHGEVPGGSSAHPPLGHIHGAVPDKFGPEIEAKVVFPAKGTYQIFSEIKHNGRVIPIDFTLEVR